jgi:DNA-binding MarR family transcriptional regulator
MVRSIALKVLDLLRRHLIAVQYADAAYGTEVSNIQSSLLSELARRVDPTIEQLADSLHTTASSISKQLTKLSDRGYLTIGKIEHDGRRNSYTITPKGMQFIRLDWRMSEELILQGTAPLSPSEQRDVEDFLQCLLGHDPLRDHIALPHESKINILFQALTFAHGVLSDNFLGSGHPNRTWLILSEILYNQRTPGQFAELLQISPSTVSVRLKSLEQAGLIESRRDDCDHRIRILSLTTKGREILALIETSAERVIGTPLMQLDNVTQERHLRAFTTYVYGIGNTATTNWTASVVDTRDLPLLAIAAANYITSCGSQYRHSGFLLHPNNIILRLSRHDASPIIIELEPVGRSKVRLANVFHGTLLDARISPATLDALIHTACQRRLVRESN